jgi:PilZ domain
MPFDLIPSWFRSLTSRRAAEETPPAVTRSTNPTERVARRNEQRRYPRLPFRASVCLKQGDVQWTGVMLNIGLGGCWVNTDAGLAAGSTVVMRLADPVWPSAVAEATVVRSTPGDLCLQFTVHGQESMIPVLFARRHGMRGREWLQGPVMPMRAPMTVYLVGIPARLTAVGLQSALSRYAAVSGVTMSRLPEGRVATVHVAHAGAVDALIVALHGKPLFGGIVLAIRAESMQGYVLRMVLQATAEARFAVVKTLG